MFATIVFAFLSAGCFLTGSIADGPLHELGPITGIATLALGTAFYLTWLSEPSAPREFKGYREVAVNAVDEIVVLALLPVAIFILAFGVVLSFPVFVLFMPLLVSDTLLEATQTRKTRGVSNRPPPFGLAHAPQGHS